MTQETPTEKPMMPYWVTLVFFAWALGLLFGKYVDPLYAAWNPFQFGDALFVHISAVLAILMGVAMLVFSDELNVGYGGEA